MTRYSEGWTDIGEGIGKELADKYGPDGPPGDPPPEFPCPNCGRSKVSDSIGHRHTGALCFWCGYSTDRPSDAALPDSEPGQIPHRQSEPKSPQTEARHRAAST